MHIQNSERYFGAKLIDIIQTPDNHNSLE